MIPRARWIAHPHLIICFGAEGDERVGPKFLKAQVQTPLHGESSVPNSIYQHFFPPCPKSLWMSVGEMRNKAHFAPAMGLAWCQALQCHPTQDMCHECQAWQGLAKVS